MAAYTMDVIPVGLGVDADLKHQQTRDFVPVADTKARWKVRYTLGLMGLLGVANLYALRVNFSVAIVTMVNYTAIEMAEARIGHHRNGYANTSTADVCPGLIIEPNTKDPLQPDPTKRVFVVNAPYGPPVIKRQTGEFVWNEERQGFMLAGFFFGYAIGQLPGGLLAERFGGKLVFGLGTFITAVLTVISPFSVWLKEDLFFVVRILEGIAEGVTFPAIQFMIAKWSPPDERSRFSIIFSGSYLGLSLCMPIAGILCETPVAGGWPLVFYVFGALGILWYVPWLFLVYDTPAKHPWISKEEREYIESTIGAANAKKRKLPIPWAAILKTPGFWACAMMHVGIGWNFFGQITYLPTYMSAILHFPIRSNAMLSALPYVVGGLASVASSLLLDMIIKKKFMSAINGYRIFNGLTGAGAAITLLLLPHTGCNKVWTVVVLTLNGLCLGAQYAGNGSNLLVLAPNFSGTMYGLSNTFANLAGILAPYTVGFLTNGNQTRGQWNIMFLISAGVGLVTFVLYLILASDKEQPWNDPPPKDEKDDKKQNTKPTGFDNEAFEKDQTLRL